MFLGIDLGTSSVKALLLDHEGTVVSQGSAPLDVQHAHPLWSEQDPSAWWHATDQAVRAASSRIEGGLRGLRAIGLSGQMHGATLLDDSDRPLRPAILWNDGRSQAQCETLERAVPRSREITGNLAMPGFTAPKLVWLREHEPDCHERVSKVLLPKDYLRLLLTGDHATDLSDASGTLWLDVARRQWSQEMLEACGLSLDAMPSLFEGPEVTGALRAEVARDWGCEAVPVVAGGGDQAAGAIGAGVVRPGQASLSLGTSGVYFVAGDRFQSNPSQAVHAFCHCLPGTWHQMSVLLSAASCLAWICKLTGASDEASLLDEVARVDRPSERLLFLPYLSGERTPHNDPHATGVIVGIDHDCGRAALTRAVLEGVAFAFADAQRVLLDAGSKIETVSVIGGGARSPLWGRILASALERPLIYRRGGEVCSALGAARLARLGVTGESLESVCAPLPEDFVAEPDPAWVAHARERLPRFRALYRDLRDSFPSLAYPPVA
ncbi:MAG: xylulokinase [Deltaproteobacteria bacterium]|nr:xylulokinase [Deltaproteobacteria bacterium]MBW2418974.1 xylulokinase [Deltaproteobacteria bacterium]